MIYEDSLNRAAGVAPASRMGRGRRGGGPSKKPRVKSKSRPRRSGRRSSRGLLLALMALSLWVWLGWRGSQTGGGASLARGAREEASRPLPRLKVEVLASYPHDSEAYTQGLLWHDHHLYESTGLNGRSSLRRVALASGEVEERKELPDELFGEGLERVGDQLYQLTWRAGLGQIWNLQTFERTGQFFYRGQGWGLCFNGKHLVLSNGSDVLSFRDPSTFSEVSRQSVRASGRRVRNLNELECVGDEIYANVYGSESIARIDGESGEVTAWIDASGLLSREERGTAEVLNGIAYVPERGTFLLTGKLWPKLFEVKFIEPPGGAIEGTP